MEGTRGQPPTIETVLFEIRAMTHFLNTEIKDLRSTLTQFQQTVDDKLEELKDSLQQNISEARADLQVYVDREVDTARNRLTEVESVVAASKEKLEEEDRFNPDTTIIADNVPFEEGEDLATKMQNMIRRNLALPVKVVRTMRMKTRPPRQTRFGKLENPGLVKIQFENVQDKVTVLREKRELKNSQDYSRGFLRSSKSHTDRLIELNFKTILDLVPGGENFELTSNGRLMQKEEPGDETSDQDSDLPRTGELAMNLSRTNRLEMEILGLTKGVNQENENTLPSQI